MTIEIRRIDYLTDELPGAYKLYERLFAEINALAAQRHLMTRAEFDVVATDARVSKYLAYAGDELVGISTLLNDLDAWPLLSPAYFRRKFPELFAAREIWYVGFVGAGRIGVFDALVTEMFPRVANGMVAMDFCTRRQLDGLHDSTYRKLRRLHGAGVSYARLDDQATFGYRFDGEGFE